MQCSDYHSVVLYKAQEIVDVSVGDSGKKVFAKDDFALGIQTKFQRDMMIEFGNSIICCDSTHGTNHYAFPLTTVLVIDDFGEGVPVAWLISNHEDGNVIGEFFSTLKERTGSLEPKWFMTDDAPQYFAAWKTIYGTNTSTKKILCRWHIDKSWRKALNEKISEREDRIDVYHYLMVLMKETDDSKLDSFSSSSLIIYLTKV